MYVPKFLLKTKSKDLEVISPDFSLSPGFTLYPEAFCVILLASAFSSQSICWIEHSVNCCSSCCAIIRYGANMTLPHLYSPVIRLITNYESPYIWTLKIFISNNNSSPKIKASYSAWLCEHCGSSLSAICVLIPIGDSKTTSIPAPCSNFDPSKNNF